MLLFPTLQIHFVKQERARDKCKNQRLQMNELLQQVLFSTQIELNTWGLFYPQNLITRFVYSTLLARTHVRIKSQNLNFYLKTHATTHNIYFIRLRVLSRNLVHYIGPLQYIFKWLFSQAMATCPNFPRQFEVVFKSLRYLNRKVSN